MRTLRRLPTFWLGLLVLLLLGASWLQSLTHVHGIIATLRGSSTSMYISHESGWLVLNIFQDSPSESTTLRPFHGKRTTSTAFPPAFRHGIESGGIGRQATWFAAAHWLVILILLLPWSAILAWQCRRLKA